MKLQTNIPLSSSSAPVDYNSKILLLGSCFAEHLGKKLQHYKFQQQLNPLGILFHPLAIACFLERVLKQETFTENDLVFNQERWHCLEAHSSMSGTNRLKVLENLNENLQKTGCFLENASHLFITLGTAWGYRYKKTDRLVANCHKIPQREFSKELVKSEEIINRFQPILKQLKQINTDLQVVFTVSPVRHLKDGFVENQRSKAQLISAVHELLEEEEKTHYFPSYEIMMDELRDYRFYEVDMLHPNALAVDYIWEKFMQVFLSPQAQQDAKAVAEIQKGRQHKAFNPQSEAHQKFLRKLQIKQERLQQRLPQLNFNEQ